MGNSNGRIDLHAIRALILLRLRSENSIRDDMNSITHAAAKMVPHPIWKEVQEIDWESGLRQFELWLPRPFEFDPPASPLKALWIGLFNPGGQSSSGYVVDCYIAGTEQFVEAGVDWACNPAWFPEGRYCESTALAPLHDMCRATSADGYVDVEQPIAEAFVAFAWRRAIESAKPATFLGQCLKLGLGFGWDAGDKLILGNLVHDGLVLPKQLEHSFP